MVATGPQRSKTRESATTALELVSPDKSLPPMPAAKRAKLSPASAAAPLLDAVPEKGTLRLADGTSLSGFSFGADKPIAGEVRHAF